MIELTSDELDRQIIACQRCPRLRDHCSKIAQEKRKAYRDWEYWGRPVPNFGDLNGRLLIVGLAPAAHGANRTGRMFTGDRSGDWLYKALHKAGFANQKEAAHAGDGLELIDCAITAVCHCAPPDNKPTTSEISQCRPWLSNTIDLTRAKVFLALGGLAWNVLSDVFKERHLRDGPRPKFSHGALEQLTDGRWLVGCYHPSQQNTFTGRLTEEMLDDVFAQVRRLMEQPKEQPSDKPKVVLDTNVLIAAARSKSSASRRIITACLQGELQAFATPAVLREYEFILRRALRGAGFRDELARWLKDCRSVDPDDDEHHVPDDPEDSKFLSAAVAANAEALVTNDHHLLSLNPYRNLLILRPAVFVRRLE